MTRLAALSVFAVLVAGGCSSTAHETPGPTVAADDEFTQLRGRALVSAGARDFENALTTIDRALELRPNDLEMHRLRVHCLAGLFAFDELLVECDRTLAFGACDAWLVYERGVALQELGRYQEALAGFTRALEIDPRHYKSLQHRGWTYQLTAQHEAAIADFTRALELTPEVSERVEMLRYRALSFAALERHDEARRDNEASDALLEQP